MRITGICRTVSLLPGLAAFRSGMINSLVSSWNEKVRVVLYAGYAFTPAKWPKRPLRLRGQVESQVESQIEHDNTQKIQLDIGQYTVMQALHFYKQQGLRLPQQPPLLMVKSVELGNAASREQHHSSDRSSPGRKGAAPVFHTR